MDQATTFSYVMRDIWGDEYVPGGEIPREAHAIASWVKTHSHVNYENALDVIYVMWPEAALAFFLSNDSSSALMCNVTFEDESRALVDCPRGIGSGVELP